MNLRGTDKMKYYLVKWRPDSHVGDRFFHTIEDAQEYVDGYRETRTLKIITLVEEDVKIYEKTAKTDEVKV